MSTKRNATTLERWRAIESSHQELRAWQPIQCLNSVGRQTLALLTLRYELILVGAIWYSHKILNFSSLFWLEQFGTHTSDLEMIESLFWFMNSSETIYASYSNIANLRATATLRTFTIISDQSKFVLKTPISQTDRV